MSSVSSASSTNAAYYASQKNLFGKLDTDENGTLSKDEFVSGRPKDVSKEQASTLYSKLDGSNSGALTEDQFDEGMSSSSPSLGIESLLSSDAMAVLMLMSQQGGMSFGGDMGGSNGMPSASDLYADMDADGDGSVTQAEFVAVRPDGMSEDDATALYATIDTEGAGSITEEQFADSMKGPPPGGMPAQGGQGAPSSEETYDALDTNKDGVVSEAEFVAAHPADVTGEQASGLFASLDTDSTGSITQDEFSQLLGASQGQTSASAANISKGIDDLLDMLNSLSSNEDAGTEAA
jgi:Ca2+-binding EF-hand superfamily protein